MNDRSLPRVAVLLGAAWPHNDASGPVQSVRMICEAMAGQAQFHVFARSGPPRERPLVEPGTVIEHRWMTSHHFDIGPAGARDLIGTLGAVAPDIYWLNSVWDREFTLPTLAALRLGRLPRRPTLLSTRGEFSEGALALHRLRKLAMRALLRRSGLLRGVEFHATGEVEAADVRRAFPWYPVLVADNVRPLSPAPLRPTRVDGILQVGYLGRISPVKGLHRALQALTLVTAPIHFSVWGPIHDEAYWENCRKLIERLPSHVTIDVKGPIANSDVAAAMASQDLFLNPSASENFGHTIIEALMAGTPVLTGTATPWNDLEIDRAGFNIPVDRDDQIAGAIDRFASLSGSERLQWHAAARGRAERFHHEQRGLAAWQAWLARAAASGEAAAASVA